VVTELEAEARCTENYHSVAFCCIIFASMPELEKGDLFLLLITEPNTTDAPEATQISNLNLSVFGKAYNFCPNANGVCKTAGLEDSKLNCPDS
jgi:hypothetical protein